MATYNPIQPPSNQNSPQAQTIRQSPKNINPNIQQTNQNTLNVTYASFLSRFGALIIDGILLAIVILPINLIIGFLIPAESGPSSLVALLILGIIYLTIPILYWVIYQAKKGQTIGKKILNIKVVDASGNTPTIGKFFIREFIGKWLSSTILMIGYLFPLFDSRKQALHNRIAGTYVVKAK